MQKKRACNGRAVSRRAKHMKSRRALSVCASAALHVVECQNPCYSPVINRKLEPVLYRLFHLGNIVFYLKKVVCVLCNLL